MTENNKDEKNPLWCDLKTIDEKIAFLKSGRAVETGIMAPAVVGDIIDVYEELKRLYK